MKKFVGIFLILALLLSSIPAFALEKPYIYAEHKGDLREWNDGTERVTVNDNGSRITVTVNILTLDQLENIVWHSGDENKVKNFKVAIRDVDRDVYALQNADYGKTYYILVRNLLNNGTLKKNVNYKIAVGAYINDTDYVWSTPYYFRIVDKKSNSSSSTDSKSSAAKPVTVESNLPKSAINVEQGKTAQLTGTLTAENGLITRVTINVTGFYNDRFLSVDLASGVKSVDISSYRAFTVDTTAAPFNVPGNYELKVYAATTDGKSSQWGTMKVTVTEPAKPDAVKCEGGFDDSTITVNLGSSKQLTGEITATNGKITNVTISVTGSNGVDYYMTKKFNNGKKSVDLSDYDVFTVNSKKSPFNVAGTYTLDIYGSTDDGQSFQRNSLTVIIKDPNASSGFSTSHSDPVISDTSPNHYITQTTVSLSGSFDDSPITLIIGEKQKLQGEFTSQNGQISSITIEITGKKSKSKKISCDQSKIDLSKKFEIDTHDYPFNADGEYTLTVYAKLSDNTIHTLGTKNVTIVAKDPAKKTSSDNSAGSNNNQSASDTKANQQTKETNNQSAQQKQPVKMSPSIPNTSINVTLGDTTNIGGYLMSENGNIAEVRLSVNGMVFAKKIINAKSVMFSDDDFIIRTDSAPFNAAGSYTVDIMACAEGSSDFETLKSVTVTVNEKKSSNISNNTTANNSNTGNTASQPAVKITDVVNATIVMDDILISSNSEYIVNGSAYVKSGNDLIKAVTLQVNNAEYHKATNLNVETVNLRENGFVLNMKNAPLSNSGTYTLALIVELQSGLQGQVAEKKITVMVPEKIDYAKKYVETAASYLNTKPKNYSSNWCGYFVYTVAEKAGMTEIFPSETGCAFGNTIMDKITRLTNSGEVYYFWDDMTTGKEANLDPTVAHKADIDTFVPQPGDIVVFRESSDSTGVNVSYRYAHVGIVESVNAKDSKIKVINGNWSNMVAYSTINYKAWNKFTSSSTGKVFYYAVAGYARPNYDALNN